MSIRDQLPVGLRAAVQDGLLDRVFRDALFPQLLYPLTGDPRPVEGQVGSQISFTRKGLLTPQTTPLGGSDPTPEAWSVEQWSVIMDDYGHTVDTDLLGSEMAISRLVVQDAQILAQNAGQSLNRIAREKLYDGYAGGNTWVTTASGPALTITVADSTGFDTVLVNGVPTPVSATNTLSISVEESGTPQTVLVEGVAGNVLTLDTSVTVIIGDVVLADNRAHVVYPDAANNDSATKLDATDVLDMSLVRAATVRLRQMNVPTIGGFYVCHLDSYSENQLFDDTEFQNVLNTNIDSTQFRELTIGAAGGVLFVRNEEAPTLAAVAPISVPVHRPLVMGQGALINAPFAGYQSAIMVQNPTTGNEINFIDSGVGLAVAHIMQLPQDRMARYMAQSWGWVGDFGVPSDSTTGDAALFKRAVMIEHA